MGRSTSTSASKNELFIGILTAALVFLMAARTPLDSDLFWHLRAGADTLRTLQPVLTDTMSYTRAGAAWANHSWLAQALLALLYRVGGFPALSGLVAGLAALCLWLVYHRMGGPALWRAFLTILAFLVSAPVWSPRPQILSLLLLLLLERLLEDWRTGRLPLWPIIPLFILWSNLHGGYPLGLLLILCWLGGGLLERGLGRVDAPSLRRLLELGAWGLAAFAAVAVNPNGAAMWRIPFQTVGVGILQQAIPEWASPDFHDVTQQPFLWMLAAILGALGLCGREVAGRDLIKVIVFAGMGLVARRNFGPFALLAAPILADCGWMVMERILRRFPVPQNESHQLSAGLQKSFNLTIFGIIALATCLKLGIVSHPAVTAVYLARDYPQAAVDWLRAHHPEGRLFSTYAWGGYLDWTLPQYPVFVDGRTDLFGDTIITKWLTVMNVDKGWEDILRSYAVHLVLVEPGQPLVRQLKQAGWQELYRDSTAVLIER